MDLIRKNLLAIVLTLLASPIYASELTECVGNGIPDRFHLALMYPRNEEWTRLMEESAALGVRMLNSNPELSFEEYLDALVTKTQFSVRSLNTNEYTRDFGDPRNFSTELLLGGDNKYKSFTQPAREFLLENGTKTTERSIISYTRLARTMPLGLSVVRENMSFQFVYEAPEGKIYLSRLSSSWDQGKRAPPWEFVGISPTYPNSIPAVIRAVGGIFNKLKAFKTSPKNDETLKQIKSYVAEMYWLMSHAWPYKRGSASVADLSTRTILDWLGIENAPWKADAEPNFAALLNYLEDFKGIYETQMTEPLRWKP